MAIDPRRIKNLFVEALDQPDTAARRALLDRECAGDSDLRQRLEVLLSAHDAPASVLNRPLAEFAPESSGPVPTIDQTNAEAAGTHIGPYKLLEQIGEGGMGTVWMAQQAEPVKRLVAVKLIKAGMDSRQVIARFEAERQALALMDHANIARVLDAGTTEAGRPYFVMDLVRGVPITRYCDDHHLTPRQRLELFIPVCQAIQHAHQKGIIHRDLKPSNVLVALYDGKPVPKVIDFGVAKAAGQSLTDKTLVTGFGNIVGTLEYMSPEQAEINQLDIDTRSDIYSLGVLLYELLTGSPPFSRKELEKAGMLEMLRLIREQEPSKPSTKLSTAEGLPTLAANRGMEPAKLTKLVRGELDWIVMKALEKDRSRRYETANGFAMDVQRYLADEPVGACPPSARYRLGKFVHRYRAPLAVALSFLLILVAAAGVSTYQAIRIRFEQQKTLAQKLDADGQRLVAQQQRKAAEDNERVARTSERLAEQRLAENLAITGDALLTSGQILRARGAYQQSLGIGKRVGVSPVAAMTGLVQSYFDSPAALMPFYTPNVDENRGVVAVSPDGRTVVTAGNGVRLWDVMTGVNLRTLHERSLRTVRVRFSHDGTMLVTSSREPLNIELWDLRTGMRTLALNKPPDGNHFLACFSADDRYVLTHNSNSICVWDVRDGTQVRRFHAGGTPADATISPDGKKIAAGCYDGLVRIYDLGTGEMVGRISTKNRSVFRLAFAPDGTKLIAAVGKESPTRAGAIILLDAALGTELKSFGPNESAVESLAFLPGGRRFASLGAEGIVRIRNVATGADVRRYAVSREAGGHLAISADGAFFATGVGPFAGAISLFEGWYTWDLSGESDIATVHAHPGTVTDCRFSPDGLQALTVDERGTLKLWDVATWQVVRTVSAHARRIDSGCLLPDGREAVTAARDAVRRWDLHTGNEVGSNTLQPLTSGSNEWLTPRFAALAHDGSTLLVRSSDTEAQIQNVKTGQVTHKLATRGLSYCAALSADGKQALVGAESLAMLWDAGFDAAPRTLSGHSMWVTCAEFSPDDKTVVTGSLDCCAIIWDLQTGKPRHILRGHTGRLNRVAVSPSGGVVASASSDGTVRLWDQYSGQQIRAFSHGSEVHALAFTAGGDALLSGGGDGTLRIWRLDWPRQLSERIGRLVKAQEALTNRPGDAEALREIGEWYVFRGKWDWALELLERAEAGGARVSALALARCCWKTGRSADAQKQFARAVIEGEAPVEYLKMCSAAEAAGTESRDLGRRAEWLMYHGRFEEAAADCERLVELQPQNQWHWVYRGCLLAYLGREEEYSEHCQAMLRYFADTRDPGKLERTTKTALLLPDGAGGDPEYLARRTWRLGPGPWSELVRGMANLRAGRHDQAAALFEQCRAARPDDQVGRTVAADAYLAIARHRLGQEPEAKAALARAVQRATSDLKPTEEDFLDELRSVRIENWLIAKVALREAENTILGP